MVTLNSSRCNLCGLCCKVCHESCMDIDDDFLRIDYRYCSTCCQCIAICPEMALSWDNHDPILFDKSNYPSPAQMEELFGERRTIRDFRQDKINREKLEKIVAIACYAPTHNFDLRAIIIDDPEIIHMIDSVIFQFIKNLHGFVYRTKLVHFLIRTFAPKTEFEYLRVKPKLEKSIERGRAFKSLPASIVLIIGEKRVPLSLESAQYALYNIDLYAQTMGLCCRNLVGNQMILNRSKSIRKLLQIRRDEKIFGTIALGYPAIRFNNRIMGKQLPIQWN